MAKPHFPTKDDSAGQLLFAATLALDLMEITAYGLCKAIEDYERSKKRKPRKLAPVLVIREANNGN